MATSSEPLGIQQLIQLDRVHIRQKSTFSLNNKYVVMDPSKNIIFYVKESSDFVNVLLAGNNRAFNIDVFDTQDKKVISLRRPFTFGTDKLEVTVCGKLVSIVRKETTFFKPVLHINSPNDSLVLRVKGPLSTSGECDFDIFTCDKKQVGVITKKWGGFTREAFTDSDNFQIRFPMDLDVGYKAAIIGTCFLIDFLYYEN